MTDSPEKHPTGAAFAERREHPRRRVESLIYVGFGDENGGIVLNLSEGGMGFHAAIALQQFHFPKVRFQLPVSGKWAEAAGDVAWMNEARTSAGLKFIDLPEEARAEIRDWVRGQGTAARPVVAQQSDEFGQPPRSPRVSVPPPAAAPAIQSENEEPAPAPMQPAEAPAEFFEPVEANQSEIAATAAAGEETHKEVVQYQASAAELPVEVVNGKKEAPVAAAALEKSPQMVQGSEPDTAGAGHRLAEAALSQDSSESGTREETRDAVADAEEDEIVAAAIAQASVVEEKAAYRASPGTSGEAIEGAGRALPFGAARDSFGCERPRAESAKRFSGRAVAAMLLGTIAISFAAGWAVGRGVLDSWIRTSANTTANTTAARTQSVPPAASPAPVAPPTTAQPSAQPAVHLPAQGSTPGPQAAVVAPSTPNPILPPEANHTAPPVDVATPAGEESSSTVELPEEPISASATIAMSATRSVDIPAEGTRRGAAHVQPGELISHVQPDYPVETMQELMEGTVKLRVTVAKDGSVKQIEPMGGPPALEGTSVSAVRQWRYRPTYVNGKPVEVQEIVKIVFRLPPSTGNLNSNP